MTAYFVTYTKQIHKNNCVISEINTKTVFDAAKSE